MKKTSTLSLLFALLLTLSGLNLQASGKTTSPEAATTTDPAYCNCDGGKLLNGSFENGTSTSSSSSKWSKSTSNTAWAIQQKYKVCGANFALIDGTNNASGIYQDVKLVAGSAVSLSAWAGTHIKSYSAKIKLTFYNSNGDIVQSGENKSVEVDFEVGQQTALKLYNLSATAPAGAFKVRVEGTASGNYLKLDAICLKVTEPSYCQDCAGNKLTNANFEDGVNGWNYTVDKDKWFHTEEAYKVCGSAGGVLYGNGKFWQDVTLVEGSQVTLKIWGAYHVSRNQKFELIFLNSSGSPIGSSISQAVDKLVESSPYGLKQYTLTGTAPAGSVKVRVQGSETGDYFKVDAACLTIVEPVVSCDCDGNKLTNGSFEDGSTGWTLGAGTDFAREEFYKVCGDHFGVIKGAGSIYQDVEAGSGQQVSVTVWGGTHNSGVAHQFKLTFLDASGNVIVSSENKVVDMTYVVSDHRLKEYNFTASAPAGTKTVRLEAVSGGDFFKIDAACVKVTGALPVTLVSFDVKKEISTANLAWATTEETNSSSFEVQHSENGKTWNMIGSVDAKGESAALVRYSFVHNNPVNGSNFYRLRMIDKDNTFAFSRLVNVNFDLAEAVQVYPNPTSDYVKLNAGTSTIEKVQLFNTQGVMVLEAKPDSSNMINLTRLTQGSYVIKISHVGGNTNTRRIQVVR